MKQNPTEFYKTRGEQDALGHIVQGMVKGFEDQVSRFGNLDYAGPAQLRYENMDMLKLLELQLKVSSLGGQVKRLKREFKLESDILLILDEIQKSSDAVLHSERATALIKKWEQADRNRDIKVDAEVANELSNQMHKLWSCVEKLKTLEVPPMISDHLKKTA